MIVKCRSMAGFDAPYVPGWDCHGLPIELNVERERAGAVKDRSPVAFRRACREFAAKFVDSQREDFKRLGVLGDWAHPYLTMAPDFQAAIVRALGKFVSRGLVYKGKKPVHWCLRDRTALAEAEVEYEPHTSPSIYVEFPLSPTDHGTLAERVPALAGRDVTVLIWTTTPWTIPANLAIAFHPDVDYGAYEHEGRVVIMAEALSETVATVTGRHLGPRVASFKGAAMERVQFRHPLYERDSLGVLADYVTLDQGTGVVHTAPGHGADDFRTGVKYGLDIYAPIGHDGRFLPDTGVVGGLKVFEANPVVENALAGARAPVAPREGRALVSALLAMSSAGHLPGDPAVVHQHGRAARGGDLGSQRRPLDPGVGPRAHDGHVPHAAGLVHLAPALVGRADPGGRVPGVRRVAADGAAHRARRVDLRDRRTPTRGTSSRSRRSCPTASRATSAAARRSSASATSSTSGSTRDRATRRCWRAGRSSRGPRTCISKARISIAAGFSRRCSSRVGTRDRAPYRESLTHGFIVDEQGRKMSKSLGNTIVPQQVMKDSGADVLRLWVSMVDYRDELRLGKSVLARTIEAYRKIRNTFRYLLANLYDFDPARDAVPAARLLEVDRFALALYAQVAEESVRAYEAYEFQRIFQAINELVTVDLSAFYVDVSKDRLYTFRADSVERRSAQTAQYVIADGLARLLAPILSMTADEIWLSLPGARDESVHLAEFPRGVDVWRDADLEARWTAAARAAGRRQRPARIGASREDDRQQPRGARHAPRRAGRSAGGACSRRTRTTCRCCSSSRRSTSCRARARSRSRSRTPPATSARAAGGLSPKR